MVAVTDVTFGALKDLEFGVERHAVTPDSVSGMSAITNLVVRHEFTAGPVVVLVANGDTRNAVGTWSVDPFDP